MLGNLLQRAVRKISIAVYDKPLPAPTAREMDFGNELRAAFRCLPEFTTQNVQPSEAAWLSYVERLRELVLTYDPREFLRWDVMLRTMFVDFASYTALELKYLKLHKEWNTRWRVAIEESQVGHPFPCLIYPCSSGNLIHQAYHLAQFEDKTQTRVSDMNYVFEFGGGYGSMCRLLFNLGFQGTYVIFDLPPLSELQRYYLQSLGLTVHPMVGSGKSRRGVVLLSDLQQLSIELSSNHITEQDSMFIGTWSISETPLSVRSSILSFTHQFGSFLVTYQDKFEEANNSVFFSEWQDSNRGILWRNWEIAHLPGNYYLVGKRTSTSRSS